jgi:hypothetical protein
VTTAAHFFFVWFGQTVPVSQVITAPTVHDLTIRCGSGSTDSAASVSVSGALAMAQPVTIAPNMEPKKTTRTIMCSIREEGR